MVPRISPLGDAALTVSFADRLDDEARDQVLGLADRLTRRADPAIVELVPAYVSLVVRYRPDLLDYATIRALVADHLGGAAPRLAPGRLIEIPVHYDGPDLDAVAGGTGLTAAEVIALHCGREYSVSLLGFVPGFAYLTELDPRLVLPRRAAPRPRVPAGSVAIAGEQTGIYPAETPGGWHLIGRTPLRVFDPAREPPSLFAVGDRVRFVPTAP
ncbi:MAG: 5-oxoprolinase subunit PxpB [Gemmatimonadales bacterium]